MMFKIQNELISLINLIFQKRSQSLPFSTFLSAKESFLDQNQ